MSSDQNGSDDGNVVPIKGTPVEPEQNVAAEDLVLDASSVFTQEVVDGLQVGPMLIVKARIVRHNGRVIDVLLPDANWAANKENLEKFLIKEDDMDAKDYGSGHGLLLKGADLVGGYAGVRFWAMRTSTIIQTPNG